MRTYYDRRAPEYDETSWLAAGRPSEEADDLGDVLAAMTPAKTLDIATGTGFISQRLPGEVVCIDTSRAMLAIVRHRIPEAHAVLADALQLPFHDRSFERIFSAHFYGHLQPRERQIFLDDARRVGEEMVVVDSLEEEPWEGWQERALATGEKFEIWKRFFTADELAEELGGEVLFADGPFVCVRADLR